MSGRSVVRRRPFVVAEVVLVALVALGALVYAREVTSGARGAWTTANAVLAVGTLLGLVLAVHGARDLRRAVGDADWPSSRRMAVVGAIWRLVEIGLVVAFVAGGVLAGAVASDLAGAGEQEGAGAITMVLAVTLVLETAVLGLLVLLIVARALLSGDGLDRRRPPAETDDASVDPGPDVSSGPDVHAGRDVAPDADVRGGGDRENGRPTEESADDAAGEGDEGDGPISSG